MPVRGMVYREGPFPADGLYACRPLLGPCLTRCAARHPVPGDPSLFAPGGALRRCRSRDQAHSPTDHAIPR